MSVIHSPAFHIRSNKIIVLDVCTTGLLYDDRIITIGAVKIQDGELLRRSIYLIFNPHKEIHPNAEQVHGFDSTITRHQDQFADLALRIRKWLNWADKLVMHNAAFNMHYLQREFQKAEIAELTHPVFCTMEHARQKWRRSLKLDECIERIGQPRTSERYGALEAAYLTAGLYLHQVGIKRPLPRVHSWSEPKNLKSVPVYPAEEFQMSEAR